MKGILEIIGILCVVQAIGGVVNNLAGSGSGSWFLVNHIDFLDGYEIFASIAVGILGLALFGAARAVYERKD